jgi:hypothetical protein
MFPDDDQIEIFLENQVSQPEAANNGEQTESFSENQALWFSNGFQRRYACDRCRGHKLRCNRDPMASSSNPCQRCIKAKAECTISSSFRPGKPSAQKQEQSKRLLVVAGDNAGHSARKRALLRLLMGKEEFPCPGIAVCNHGLRTKSPYSKSRIKPDPITVMEDYPSVEQNRSLMIEQSSSVEQTRSPLIEQSLPAERIPSSQRNTSSSRCPTQFLDSRNPPLSYHEQQDGDILQLFSVPWMDIMNMDFDPEGTELPYGNALGQPFSSATTKAPNGDSSTNSRLSNFAPISISNGYGIEQAGQPMNTRKTPAQTDARVSANVKQLLNPGETHYDSSSLESSKSPGQLDFIGDLRSTIGSISTRLPSYPSERSTSPMLMNRKEAYMQRLSELSANLMKDLNRMIACKLACSFIFTPSDKKTAEYLFRTADGSLCQNNGISRLFQGTEKFLEILREYEAHSQVTTPMDDLLEPSNFGQSLIDHSANPQQRIETRWSVIESYLGRSKPPGLITPTSTASETSENSSLSQSAIIDIPSITILNCYVSLLKTFEALFLSFQCILQVPSSSPLYTRLPPVIPDFHIDGFQLKNYRSLQLKILIQVSRHMLDSMEKAMGFTSQNEATRGGIFGDPIFQNLLQTLLERNALDMPEEDSTGMKKVRDLLASMESVLNAQ